MIGTVGLEELKVTCKVGGVDVHEKAQMHDLLVDVQMEVDMSAAIKGDHFEDVVDYQAIAEAVEKGIGQRDHHLIETVAHDILQILFDRFGTISWAWVRVRKPQAVALAKDAFVEMESFREEELLE